MSSARITLQCFVWLLLAGMATAIPPRQASTSPTGNGHSSASTASPGNVIPADPAQLFQRGQDALTQGRLDDADRDFRQVLALNAPQTPGAYVNLGVIYMRRKQWTQALEMLHKAEHLLPQVPGIRLNIGLAYYRQSEFLKAIPPFESVVRDQPDSLQARYLLGQCYFFAERWADAVSTLQPLWPQESGKLDYLYVLAIAADRAGQKDLDEKAVAQLVKVGGDSPQFHLFMGKAHLNLDQYDAALAEFQAAAAADPKLPFVHFNLGLTYLKQQDYPQARDEFLKDIAAEPDLALNYDKLGDVYWLMQDDKSAEKSYREALRRDSRLVNSRLGLAKIYQRQEKLAQALVEMNAAEKLDPARTDVHYVRGQILLHMGRKEEAKKELEASVRIDNEHRSAREKQMETGTVPSPELLQDPQ